MASHFQRYWLPGLTFQGIVIGGGYATGRELIEFFLPSGPIGGLLGLAVAGVVWSLVMAVAFELCRRFAIYDYRRFFHMLLGRAGFLYEILFAVLLILVLAVIGSAAGEILATLLGLPRLYGSLMLFAAVGVLAFYGAAVIERFMGIWSLLLYALYAALVLWSFQRFGGVIAEAFSAAEVAGPWARDGLRYAGYNMATIPAVFFCLRHITRRREALTAGLLAGLIGIFPAVLLFVALLAVYPDSAAAAVPSALLLERLNAPLFAIVFQLVLLGTFVQTGIGLLHSVNERVAAALAERGRSLPRIARPLLAVTLLTLALLLALTFGIVTLIARGYGWLTWGFILVLVVPVLTRGVYLIVRAPYPLPSTLSTQEQSHG